MKKVILTSSLIAVLSLSFISCKKKETATPTKTTQELLTSGSWLEVKSTTVESDTTITEYPDYCETDDSYTFKSNGDFISNYGTLKCDIDEEPTDTAKYVLSSDNKTIFLTF
ncbi:MAG: hypothetical protein U0V72_04085 [Cytophagales bacterium]